jgi:hypothetical protein
VALATLLGTVALAAAGAPDAAAAICGAPSIDGTEQAGSTLRAEAGSCSDIFAPDVTLEWYRCSAATPAACTTRVKPAQPSPSSYTATAADAGLRLGVKQVASGGLPPSDEDWGFTGVIAAPPAPPPGGGPGGPAPDPAAAPLLSPFPVVAIAGRLTRRGARFTKLAVRGPAGSSVRVRCKGRGCPKRTGRRTIGRKGSVRLRRFQTVLRHGTLLELVIAKPGYVGKFTSFQIRRRRPPLRTDSCVQPGATTPSPCPA